jgi:hypothetical protein
MLIDVDLKPEESIELEARVIADAAGEGVIEPRTARRWSKVLRGLIGKEIRITLTRFKARSLPQNRLLWRTYTLIYQGLRERCLEEGIECPFQSKDDLHDAMRAAYIGDDVVEVFGDRMTKRGSSARLTVQQFSAYLEAVVARAASWSIFVPMPGDLMREIEAQTDQS